MSAALDSTPMPLTRPHAVPARPEIPVDRESPTPTLSAPKAPDRRGHAPAHMVPPAPAPAPAPPPPAPARAEPLIGMPDMARTVREMLPPPKANVPVGDLPSVIVDDPETEKEKIARARQTVRLAVPPSAVASPGKWADAAARAQRSAGLTYEQRKSRNRRRLVIVAFVSFAVVFAVGAGLLGLHYLSVQGRLTWPPR